MEKGELSRVSTPFLVLLLLLSIFSMLTPKVKSSTLRVPQDYPTIQTAINAASDGDLILVSSGIYYENIVVNKTVSLFGEDGATIYGEHGGKALVYVAADDVTVTGFTITQGANGIHLQQVNNCSISNNTIVSSGAMEYGYAITVNYSNYNFIKNNNISEYCNGIMILNSSNNVIAGNEVRTNDIFGVGLVGSSSNIIGNNTILWKPFLLIQSSDNTLRNNTIIFSDFLVLGFCLSDYFNDIDTTNTVRGRLIYYWINRKNEEISQEAGFIGIINSTNITVRNQKNIEVLFAYTNDSIIENIDTSYRDYGIIFHESYNNTVCRSTINSNVQGMGITLMNSSYNKFYHNNVIKGKSQVGSGLGMLLENGWDDGYPSGGNYWSDYNGTDFCSCPHQNETGGDGIGDTPFIIDEKNVDNYPLMGPFRSFNASFGYSVDVVSNSTIEDFEYFELNNTIKIIVSNVTENQTKGFCKFTIPHNLIAPPYNITVNNKPIEYQTLFENETVSVIYFSYEHSKVEIIIIPEFPATIIMPMLLIHTTISLILARKRCSKNLNRSQSFSVSSNKR